MFKDIQSVLLNPVTLPLVAIALLCIVVFWTLITLWPDAKLKERRFSQSPLMNALAWLGVALVIPVVLVVAFAFWELLILALKFPDANTPASEIRWHASIMLAMLAAIGAVFTLVFAFIRAFATERQTRATEEGLITEQISKAVEGLGAEKTVKDGKKENSARNIEVRVGAIYALERIAQDSDRDHIRIMEILCAYIRENAPAANASPCPFESEEAPESDEVNTWAQKLKGPTTDIRIALEVIGRRTKKQIALERDAELGGRKFRYQLDLRGTCLQRADLSELDFSEALLNGAQMQWAIFRMARMRKARLSGAWMQGVDLREARMQRADFYEARMQGAHLSSARLQGADFNSAWMQAAHLDRARMSGAVFLEARMQGVNLTEAKIQGADLRAARMQGTNLCRARMDEETKLEAASLQGAAVREVDLEHVRLLQKQVDEMFGDGSVKLPSTLSPPNLWPKTKLDSLMFQAFWISWKEKIGYDPSTDTP
ncbi:MAG: pentapeptide repeat-containing protein [Paracoccaceae bacterium]